MNTAKTGYCQSSRDTDVKRYCQTLDLVDDNEKIALYRKCHDSKNIWKEIPEGLREIGILDMEIYIEGNRLFMIVETPSDFEWDTAFAKLASMPRQAEWEAFVGAFQKALPGASSDEKWHLMERMFKLP